MHIVTNTHEPAHRIAFGSREAADGFIAAASDPAAWALNAAPAAASSGPTSAGGR